MTYPYEAGNWVGALAPFDVDIDGNAHTIDLEALGYVLDVDSESGISVSSGLCREILTSPSVALTS